MELEHAGATRPTRLRVPIVVVCATVVALAAASVGVAFVVHPVREPLRSAMAPLRPQAAASSDRDVGQLLVDDVPVPFVEVGGAPEHADGLSPEEAAELLGAENPEWDRQFLVGNGYRNGAVRWWAAPDGSWLFSSVYELASPEATERWMADMALAVAHDGSVEPIDSPVPGAVAYRRYPIEEGSDDVGFEVFFAKGPRLFHVVAVGPTGDSAAMEDVMTVSAEQYRRG